MTFRAWSFFCLFENRLRHNCHLLNAQRCQKPVAKAISPEHSEKYHTLIDAIAFQTFITLRVYTSMRNSMPSRYHISIVLSVSFGRPNYLSPISTENSKHGKGEPLLDDDTFSGSERHPTVLKCQLWTKYQKRTTDRATMPGRACFHNIFHFKISYAIRLHGYKNGIDILCGV